uniref:Uncharacterized protein n=1 Tax=Myotis myotis TaxID=51298 RepID=A0A7J7Z632_MYOMY|nr:hypothetical protein mMyoMyo1_010805 [Myotis myotis]
MGLRPMGQVLNVCSACFLVSMRGAGGTVAPAVPGLLVEGGAVHAKATGRGGHAVSAGSAWHLLAPACPSLASSQALVLSSLPPLSFLLSRKHIKQVPAPGPLHTLSLQVQLCPWFCVAPAYMSNVRGALTFLPESTHWYSVSSHNTLLSTG